MKRRGERGHTYWHPAFRAAMRLELRRYKHVLEFHDELQLGAEPNIVDLMVIKLDRDAVIDTDPWTYLLPHNVFEFKSPSAGMSIDDLYKALGRTCEYKALGNKVNAIKSRDITLTMVRESRPAAMMRALKSEGSTIETVSRGVYAVRGRMPFETRIIAYGEMDEASCGWLDGLTKRLTESAAMRLLDATQAMTEKDDAEHANALLYASMQTNSDVFFDMSEEGRAMINYEVFRLLFDKKISQEVSDGIALGEARGVALGEARGEARGRAEEIISMGRDLDLPKETILSRLIAKLGCSRDDAERMLREA